MTEKTFLQDVLDSFPDILPSFLVLLDWLEDNGQEDLASFCREILEGKGIVADHPYVRKLLSISVYTFLGGLEEFRDKDDNEYYFHGNGFYIRRRHKSGWRGEKEELNLNDVDPIFYKPFIILVARFILRASTNINDYGLTLKRNRNYEHTKKSRKELEERLKNKEDAYLRYALRGFLQYFGEVERDVLHRNRLQRVPWQLDRDIVQALHRNGTGYQWDYQYSMRVVERYLAKHSSQFLQDLAQRITIMLTMLHDTDIDDIMLNQFRTFVNYIYSDHSSL
jgi:hypothetical protein